MIDNTLLSKMVSHALRHEPWLYELELDDEGWIPVEELVESLRREGPEWSRLTAADIARMIDRASKQRHEIRKGRIRALYGHSQPGKFAKTPGEPPDVLYYGTGPARLPSIRNSGLLPMGRQYVHLSVDEATALRVGRRKAGNPSILKILASEAHAGGVKFYSGNETIWLADGVPAKFIVWG
ncbi:MAG: RNA 2'-phosphotransferase [Planctomycetota bacterium]|nr:MAG: RNA 2'-phosphotransferase [Planctomycetota bacterium]